MLAVDLMLEGFLGLFGTYRTYIELIKIWGLFRGLEDWIMVGGHMINSVVLSLVFVHPKVYRKLPGKLGLIKGLVFGLFWHLFVLTVISLSALGGSQFMKEMLDMPLRDHISLFVLHVIWGATLGVLYTSE